MDKIGLIYAPLCALSPTPWGWGRGGGRWRETMEAELRMAANAGANCVRVLALAPWLQNGEINPAKIMAPFEVGSSGRFALASFHEGYFARIRILAEAANAVGMALWIDLFDHCGRSHPNSPWVTNEEGISDYASERADQYTKAYIRQIA